MSTPATANKPDYIPATRKLLNPLFTSPESNTALKVCDGLVRLVALAVFGPLTLLLDAVRDAYILISSLSNRNISKEPAPPPLASNPPSPVGSHIPLPPPLASNPPSPVAGSGKTGHDINYLHVFDLGIYGF